MCITWTGSLFMCQISHNWTMLDSPQNPSAGSSHVKTLHYSTRDYILTVQSQWKGVMFMWKLPVFPIGGENCLMLFFVKWWFINCIYCTTVLYKIIHSEIQKKLYNQCKLYQILKCHNMCQICERKVDLPKQEWWNPRNCKWLTLTTFNFQYMKWFIKIFHWCQQI